MAAQADRSNSTDELRLLAESRASFGAFLNLHFLALPDAGFVGQLLSGDVRAMLERLAGDEQLPADLVKGAGLMLSFLADHAALDAGKLSEELGVDRTRLYRGVSPTYGPPSPYEAEWLGPSLKLPQFLQELGGLYHQSGLSQEAGSPERADYIGVELAYLVSLAEGEAALLASGDPAGASQARDQQSQFLRLHLLPWVLRFVEKALEFARTDFYRGHLLMLRGFLLEQDQVFSAIGSGSDR